MSQKQFHSNNIHNQPYDLELLISKYSALESFVIEGKKGNNTIDFSNPKSVKVLNTALLKAHYNIQFWEFPEENLCPPIPGRVDYIHYVSDLIGTTNAKVLDIGTGATLIYPLLGNSVYNWSFVGSDISRDSLVSAQKIIDRNNLNQQIELRYQSKSEHVLNGILNKGDAFDAVMCNPPFYASEKEARGANARKSRNLGNAVVRNFAGNSGELWYKGGEKAFLHTYLYESSQYSSASKWFTSLVSKKENVKSLETSAKKLNAKEFKVIQMQQGNKATRIVAWRFN